ncbi:hypothetical protein B0T10DRAFT_500793 [Thelonectria olida]|uniref:MARVEL domain-containing protein n=1 Tax=Thelonectria olida TaxID=1576542 RepID=A0A9P9AES3_9HYPO|nr:hypothetical protein B0T10DRAFT_500793 [Thelonectria olida]
MSDSGAAHKIVSVILRFIEFSCAVIVLGLLSRLAYMLSIAGVNMDGRLVYTMVVAGIGIAYSIIFCLPFDALFTGFALDFILFIMWLVAFCLLETKTKSHTCSATWYYNYWGYYWGHYWTVGPAGRVNINQAGCAQWRTVLAFSFIAWFFHLISGILGVYVFRHYVLVKDMVHSAKQQMQKMSHSNYTSNGYTRDSTHVEPTQEQQVDPAQARSEV